MVKKRKSTKAVAKSSKPDAKDTPSDLYLISEDDAMFEQEILRHPESIRPWIDYAYVKRKQGSLLGQAFVLERACSVLPRSYKLWKAYLELRTEHLKGRNPAHNRGQYTKVNRLFERALVLLNKMPRIWEMYLTFLMAQPLITLTRRTFDRALRALPVTQHGRIWALYRPFATSASGETAVRIWRRYIQLHPEDAEEFISLLFDMRKYTEAVKAYMGILDNPRFRSKEVKGPFQLWTEMLEVLIDHARDVDTSDVTNIDVEKIVRSGIERFSDQRGILWVGLARYWINRGDYERARDVFEEGITTVMTVRDFTVIFDTYAEAEEALISIKMDEAAARAEEGAPVDVEVDAQTDLELDLRMMRLEQLMDRRPFLVNEVLLRQNPHSVAEWQKRVALWGDNTMEAVQTYTDAIATIDPKRAAGRLHDLWTSYAQLYERGGDLVTARTILEKAVKVPYRTVAELAETWCAWAEMELRAEDVERARTVMSRAKIGPKRSRVDYFDEQLSAQQRVHKSWRVWSFYIDLVEGTSSLEESRAVYERVIELRIATPQTIANYAALLEEHGYVEDSFRAYERGLELFNWPVAFELWNIYLRKAVDRQLSLERLRDLFEQAVDGCPATLAKPLYLMYGAVEEERGLARHAMRIYERATRAVDEASHLEMFKVHITKSAANFGLPSTRPIYERAIAALPEAEAAEMCLRFADMERRLGEVDRARAIFGHGAQFCDPRRATDFWQQWEQFEVRHGNEDTFKEMLRIKRSVQAQFKYVVSVLPLPFRWVYYAISMHVHMLTHSTNSTDVHYIASQAVERSRQVQQAQADGHAEQTGTSISAVPAGFVAASTGPEGARPTNGDTKELDQEQESPTTVNPDAIEVDDEDL